MRSTEGSHASSSEPAYGIGVSSPDRKSTRLNSSHSQISYAVFCLKKKIPCSKRNDADRSRLHRCIHRILTTDRLAERKCEPIHRRQARRSRFLRTSHAAGVDSPPD